MKVAQPHPANRIYSKEQKHRDMAFKESQGNGLKVYSACFSLIADEHGLCPHQPLWNQGSHEPLKVTLQLHMDVNLGG